MQSTLRMTGPERRPAPLPAELSKMQCYRTADNTAAVPGKYRYMRRNTVHTQQKVSPTSFLRSDGTQAYLFFPILCPLST